MGHMVKNYIMVDTNGIQMAIILSYFSDFFLFQNKLQYLRKKTTFTLLHIFQ